MWRWGARGLGSFSRSKSGFVVAYRNAHSLVLSRYRFAGRKNRGMRICSGERVVSQRTSPGIPVSVFLGEMFGWY